MVTDDWHGKTYICPTGRGETGWSPLVRSSRCGTIEIAGELWVAVSLNPAIWETIAGTGWRGRHPLDCGI